MGRLIDVDEFWRRVSNFDLDDETKKVILIVLSGMPSAYGETADVVEVVRCGECKYWVSDGGALMICDIHKDPTMPEHFCSYGERSSE